MDAKFETIDVIICGCGPTGAMLSTQLGRLGVRNIVLEREADITNDPRGIALDEDGIRSLQSVGLYDHIHTEIGQCMGTFNFIGGKSLNLHKRPFLKFDYATTEGGTGHVGFICHKQPLLEKNLRNGARATGLSDIRTQYTMKYIDEDEEWVYATATDRDSVCHTIRAKYLVGCDGKTGYTRKHYLEPKGVRMEHITTSPYEETWVALNWKLTLPTPNTHPNFPAWKLGRTPEQVYDDYFPKHFRFLCNPDRPAVCGRFGLPSDRLWRFEFVVQPSENPTDMASESALDKVVRPYLTRPGSDYGVAHDVPYPKDCIETLRARPFKFTARSCNTWAVGRTILCGDAAHVFPPFGGQGITSGFRDVCSLAWRLKIATQPGFRHQKSFFAAWYRERKQQLDRSLRSTIENGNYVTEANPIKTIFRDIYYFIVQLVPQWNRLLEQGARREGMIQYTFESGMHFLPEYGGGKLFPQVYCVTLETHGSWGRICFTDDVIFSPEKMGIFQVVALADSFHDAEKAKKEASSMEGDAAGLLSPSEMTIVVRHAEGISDASAKLSTETVERTAWPSVVRVATGPEFASSSLCNNRPAPKFYDEARLFKEVPGKRFVILRHDRFIFAACRDVAEVGVAVARLGNMFECTTGG